MGRTDEGYADGIIDEGKTLGRTDGETDAVSDVGRTDVG